MVQQLPWWKVLTRRKALGNEGADGETKLSRVLGLYDLTALGVGSTLGAGVYVLAGQIAKDQAGPSVIISFAIAALASLLAGVCYAEFGARVPKAGSAYVYSYVCIGEFAAFVIGWNLMLEYMIGTAAVCRGISLYLDTLINDALKTTFSSIAPMNVTFFGSYFDFFAFGLVVVFGVALAFGVETSAMANNFCTCLNLSILLFVIIAGSIKANIQNWRIDVATVTPAPTEPETLGSGGFFPFGFEGTLKGAATCFFGFVGFDCIATTGEEVRNPRKNIPRSILLSLFIIFLCYFGVSTVLTLMVPYYRQDPNAPLPYAFKEVGWTFAMWIVSVGGLIGLLASLFGALFPLPRVMYSMAEDGLLFRFLGKVSPRYRVPVVGSIFAAIVTALIAGLFDLAQLVNLLSIGTLLAYSVVAISVTILRYMDNSDDSDRENGNQPQTETSMLTSSGTRVSNKAVLTQLFNFKRIQTPNDLSTRIVGTLITLFCLLSLGIGLIFMQAFDALINNQLWVFIVLGVLVALTAFVLLAICLQPRETYTRFFRVPLVPIVPAISIFINIYLMLQLDIMTWVRFGIWMAIGIPIFIACWCMYDIKNPDKRNPDRVEFEKLLKAGSAELQKPLKGDIQVESMGSNNYLKPDSGYLEKNSMRSLQNGGGASLRNEHSVKSIDEIMDMNEVSEDLIEMKHPNGKVFYIEDTKSNRSATSTGSLNGERKTGNATGTGGTGGAGAGAGTSSGSDTTDDEITVLALLDDVLEAEDDETMLTPNSVVSYTRKISVDSEMLPSVIETTTVATVHSSSSGSSEKDLDEVPEVEGESGHSLGSSSTTLTASLNNYAEKRQIAERLVDEILVSEELWQAVEQRRQLSALVAHGADGTNGAESAEPLKRSTSEASMLSTASVEDPLRSEKFKNKLSKIILGLPANNKSNKELTNPTPADDKESRVEPTRPALKQSKSEADVRQLLLKAIEGTRTDNDVDESERPSFDTDSKNTNAGPPSKAIITDVNGIPKPPKFDPVLYKTINSLSPRKVRPKLEKVTHPEVADGPLRASPTKLDDPEVPFKIKLEAILKRGPSHRTQKRPEVAIRRPKSMLVPVENDDDIAAEPASDRKRLTTKSESNLSFLPDPAEAINDARKSLKPVKMIAAVQL